MVCEFTLARSFIRVFLKHTVRSSVLASHTQGHHFCCKGTIIGSRAHRLQLQFVIDIIHTVWMQTEFHQLELAELAFLPLRILTFKIILFHYHAGLHTITFQLFGPVTLYGDIALGQHWSRSWVVAWGCHALTGTKNDLLSVCHRKIGLRPFQKRICSH